MTALKPRKRRITAKEAAEEIGVSARTIRNYMAQTRDEWIADQAARREAIRRRHDADGLNWQQVADEYGIDRSTAIRLGYRARKERAAEQETLAREQSEKRQPPLFDV
jgi:transposase